MDTKEEVLDFLKQNRKYLYDHYHITKIGLFGSFARDEQRADSDIDNILIDIENNTRNIHELKSSLKTFLAGVLKRKVDLARENI